MPNFLIIRAEADKNPSQEVSLTVGTEPVFETLQQDNTETLIR